MLENPLTKLARENNNAQLVLDEPQRNTLRQMVGYVRSKGLGMYETEEFRGDMIGMLQEAALRGENLDDLLGDTRQAFCDRVLENASRTRWEPILYTLFRLSGTCLVYAALQYVIYGSQVPLTAAYGFVLLLFWAGQFLNTYLARFGIHDGWKKRLPVVVTGTTMATAIALTLLLGRFDFPPLLTIGWPSLVCMHAVIYLLLRAAWCHHIRQGVQRAIH